MGMSTTLAGIVWDPNIAGTLAVRTGVAVRRIDWSGSGPNSERSAATIQPDR